MFISSVLLGQSTFKRFINISSKMLFRLYIASSYLARFRFKNF